MINSLAHHIGFFLLNNQVVYVFLFIKINLKIILTHK